MGLMRYDTSAIPGYIGKEKGDQDRLIRELEDAIKWIRERMKKGEYGSVSVHIEIHTS
jgi:hypothetical protein